MISNDCLQHVFTSCLNRDDGRSTPRCQIEEGQKAPEKAIVKASEPSRGAEPEREPLVTPTKNASSARSSQSRGGEIKPYGGIWA